ncbi:MAG: DUF86 domain-containing protein [Desulfobacteraceae bacterium]|nr:DUF86 domain-containing protein [Desulfobacteraceae bacterium]
MAHRDWKSRIEDIIDSIHEIYQYTDGISYDEFVLMPNDKAVSYCLAIIGEAARHIPAEVRTRYPEIPWQVMGDMRNVMIHEYFGIDLNIVWETVCYDLSSLLPALQKLLQSEHELC